MSLLYLEDFKIDNEMFKSYLAHTWEWFIKVALWLNFSVRFQINFFFSFTLKTSFCFYIILIPETGFSLKFIKYDNQNVVYGSLLTVCFIFKTRAWIGIYLKHLVKTQMLISTFFKRWWSIMPPIPTKLILTRSWGQA